MRGSQFRIDIRTSVNSPGPAGCHRCVGGQLADDQAFADPGRIATQADFGRELTALRERAGLKIREVARAARTPVSTTGDYFSGRHLPTDSQQLIRILAACGETDPGRVAEWEAALARARRPPGRRTGTPYRGLARFEAEDARWFFGREDVTDKLVSLAAEAWPLPLMLVGASGAGKSSVLRAGLLPRLRELAEAAPGIAGPVTVFEPTATPVADLKARLAELAAESGSYDGRPAVIVDQFEAVFTVCTDEAQRRDFITGLCDLAGTALVILALRADFYDHAIRYPGLASALQSRQVLLGPMTAGQVRRAVTEPARLARVSVEDGLVGLLLTDLAPDVAPGAAAGAGGAGAGGAGAYEPGALPLLSHAMLATWEESRGGTLAIADYLASGGIKDALTRTAERAYGGLTADQQRLARRLFLRLVHVADDLPPSRATVDLSELREWDDAEAVLATFVNERMITVDAGTAQITHDALLVAWPRLRSWIEDGTEGLRTRRRITLGARAWEQAGRESAALWRGSQLALAREWTADEDNRAALPGLAAEFVDASVAESFARERAQRRRTRRLQAMVAVLTVLVVAVAGLTAYVFQQRQTVVAAQHQTSSGEAALEADQVRAQDPPLAAQLSVSAYGLVHSQLATASLLESSGTPSAARIVDSAGIVQWAAVSPDHKLIAAAGADGTLRLWDVARPGHPSPGATLVRADANRPLYVAAFSPSGRVLAAAGAGRVIRLWDVSDPARPRPLAVLTGPGNTIYSVAFSPSGQLLAAASQDKKVWLWKLPGADAGAGVGASASADTGGAPVADGTLAGATNWANTVAFSPDGRSLAAGTSDASVLVWNLATRALTATLPQTQPVTSVTWDGKGRIVSSDADGTVSLWTVPTPVLPTGNAPSAVAYSPGGKLLAVGGQTVQTWNAARRELVATHTLAPGVFVNGLAYSPNGRVIAAAYSDGTAGLLDAATLAPLGAPFRVTAMGNGETVAFSPSGNLLATGGDDGTVRLWSLADPARPRALSTVRDSGTYVFTVVFSPDGRTLAAASTDNLTRLWGVSLPSHPVLLGKPLGGFTSYAIGLAFIPDGKLLAVGSADKTVRLWNIAQPSHPVLVGTPLTGPAGYVWALAFSPDGKTLAAGVTDGTVWLWNVASAASPSLIATLTGPAGHVYSVAFAPAGGQLAASSDDGTVHLWDTNPATAEAAICADLGQPLTTTEWSAYVPDVPYHAPCS
jgi:WD40 repeat protein